MNLVVYTFTVHPFHCIVTYFTCFRLLSSQYYLQYFYLRLIMLSGTFTFAFVHIMTNGSGRRCLLIEYI